MTEVQYKPRIDRWVGRREDGMWFMTDSEEKVLSFDRCVCSLTGRCPEHQAEDKLIMWKDVQRL